MSAVWLFAPAVPQQQMHRMHALAVHPRRTDRHRPWAPPAHLPQPGRGPRASRVAQPPGAHRPERDRTTIRSKSPGLRTFVAGRCSGDCGDSSDMRRPAQSRAEIESPRARGPYTVRCEFSPATTLRHAAQAKYSKRFLDAYDHRHSPVGGRQTAKRSSRRRLKEVKQLAKVVRCYRLNAEQRDPSPHARLPLLPLGRQPVTPNHKRALHVIPPAQQRKPQYSSSHGQASRASPCSTTSDHLPAMYWLTIAHCCQRTNQHRSGRINLSMETSR